MTIQNLHHNDFQEVKGIAAADEFLGDMKALGKLLNQFKDHHRERLLNIRINVAAHRDIDINKQLKIIGDIDPYEMMKLMFEFEKIVRGYIDKLQWFIVRLVKAGN